MAGQVGVPGVRVHQVRAGRRGGHRQVGRHGGQRRVGAGQRVPRPVRHRGRPVRALAVHGQVDETGQLPGQVLDVHPGAAVHLRRVLPGQQRDPEPAWPSPLTRAPPGPCRPRSPRPRRPRTRGPGRGPCPRPPTTPSGTTTFLSRIALRTTARRPIWVLCMITDRSTVAQLFTRAPGQSTDLRTSPPDTITPLLTRLSDRPADPVAVVVHELGRGQRRHVGVGSASGRCTG